MAKTRLTKDIKDSMRKLAAKQLDLPEFRAAEETALEAFQRAFTAWLPGVLPEADMEVLRLYRYTTSPDIAWARVHVTDGVLASCPEPQRSRQTDHRLVPIPKMGIPQRWHGYHGNGCLDMCEVQRMVGFTEIAQLAETFNPWCAAHDAHKAARAEALEDFNRLLAACNTVEDVAETWPGAAIFLPRQVEPADDGVKARVAEAFRAGRFAPDAEAVATQADDTETDW